MAQLTTQRWRAVVGQLVAVTVVLIALTGSAHPSPAGAQVSGSSDLAITVDLEAQRVLVEETIHPTGGGNAIVWVPAEAVEITTDASVVARRDRGTFVELELAGEPDGAVISYALPSTRGRAAQGTRVNTAMVGFHLWPNFEQASVTVELPPGFAANVGPPFVPVLIGDETLAYRIEDVSIDELWGYWFVAFRDSGLATRRVDIGDSEIVVAGWADDPAWIKQAVRYVSGGVPLLAELIGQPWPARNLRVVESVAPAQEGYGGWYDVRRSEIELPDSLDGAIMLHELSHAWFNDRWLQERWMIEGLAEEYASLALSELDGALTEPVDPGAPPPELPGLNGWRSRLFFEETWDTELYGYRASFWIIDQLRTEIGIDGMAATIDVMANHPHAYAVEADGRAAGTNDWRRFLDALERHGGSTGAERLFRDYVVSSEEAELLDTRREAITRYDAFGGSQPELVPEAIRIPMAEWRFDRANTLMDEAEAIMAEMSDLADRAEDIGLGLPAYLTSLYLASESSFALVDQAIDDTGDLLMALEADPDELNDDDRRNFSLGRYELIDVESAAAPGVALNQDREPGQPIGTYLIVVGVLAGLLLAAIVVFVRVAAVDAGPTDS